MLIPTRTECGLVALASVSVLPLVSTSGWAGGINAYAVVLLLGLFGAAGLTDEVPQSLQRTDALIAAGVLCLCEAVADEVPDVDSAWDSVHTVIRPMAGAVVAALPRFADPPVPPGAAPGAGRRTRRRRPAGATAPMTVGGGRYSP